MCQPNYSRDPLRHASSAPNGRFLVQPVTFWLVARRFLALSFRERDVSLFYFIFSFWQAQISREAAPAHHVDDDFFRLNPDGAIFAERCLSVQLTSPHHLSPPPIISAVSSAIRSSSISKLTLSSLIIPSLIMCCSISLVCEACNS